MAECRRVLLLGGTEDSRVLAERLAGLDGVEVISSLAGRTEQPRALPGSLRIGGFGGVDALVHYLHEERIDLLVDATHPFAERISANAEAACRRGGTPHLMLRRRPWQAVAGDHWITVSSAAGAAEALAGAALPRPARRVFLTVGRQELTAFAALLDIWFLVRMIDGPQQALPLARCEVVLGRGPFHEAGERALFQNHRIDTLVTRNSGSLAAYPKVAVARELGLPVVMIEPPATMDLESVESVDAAVQWVMTRLQAQAEL